MDPGCTAFDFRYHRLLHRGRRGSGACSLQAISREEAERIISSYVPVELEMKPITEYPLE